MSALRRLAVPVVVLCAAVAAVAAAPSAGASTTAQTAKDLAIARRGIPGFTQTRSPTLVKGPVQDRDPCGRSVTFAPKGGTFSEQDFQKVRSRSADGTTLVLDELTVLTVLTPSEAAAASVWSGLRLADQTCPSQRADTTVGDVPISATATLSVARAGGIRHTQWGFAETAVYSGTATVGGSAAPIGGAVQTLVYQRDRVVQIITLDSVSIVTSADGSALVSLTHLLDAPTRAALKAYAKIAVTQAGRQT